MQYLFEDFLLDTDCREIRRGQRLLSVEPQVFDLLVYLVQNRHRVVTRDDLLTAIWKRRIVSEATLTSRINAARTVLGDNGRDQRLIRTMVRQGVRFLGSIRENASEPPSQEAVPRAQLPPLELPDKPSLAVLAFDNLSGDPAQDYFCDGIVDDIITGLSRIRWLFVVARNSSFAYKGRAVDLKQVGRELGVRYLLEGSVRRAAKRVRVNGQLIDAATGAHLWAERYDRVMSDIFTLEDEITLSVVGAIEPTLRLAEVERAKRKRPESLDAYDLVLRAQQDTFSRMPEPSIRALVLLERALALDSTYALAHAYAAECHHSLFVRGGQRAENKVASISHAEAAIRYGQDDAAALALAGFVIGMDKHDRAAAFTAFEAALAVSPSSALTYILGSAVLGWGGEAERAIEWGEQGLRLSPFDPWRASAYAGIALGHFHQGRYPDAASAARKAVQSSPAFSISYVLLAAVLSRLGRIEEAKDVGAHALALQETIRFGLHLQSVGCDPALAASLGDALRTTGLPE